MSDDEITLEIFRGMTLTPEEQAKVDVLRTDWARSGTRAMDAFMTAEPALVLRAIDHIPGLEAVRNALIRELIKTGMTVADLARLLRRKPN
jgi:hypothetical protein